jgi:hypothetical protein
MTVGAANGSRPVTVGFDAGDQDPVEIYEAFERMLAGWPDARVPLKTGAAKGAVCGCGTDHGGWTCSHCTKEQAMKPSICRMVQVPVDPRSNNGSDIAPAVITRVWSDTCVNVRVLPDAGDTYVLTSQVLHESREALQEAHIAAWALRAGEVPMSGAFWPPRV